MSLQLSPAQYVIRQFGGVRPLARLLDVHPSTISRWPMPRERKGLEGRVPQRWHRKILDMAGKRGLDIRPEDLVLGRTGRKGRRAA